MKHNTFVIRGEFQLLVFLFALLAVVSWLFDLGESTPTGLLVLRPPEVICRWCPIHCTLHIAIIWLSMLTWSITTPPVLTI